MTGRLKSAIKQNKPFASREAEAFLNLQRTADALARGVSELLKPADLSLTQYNVLRILRGAGDEGLSCGEIANRMVTRDPDITRLLDRLDRRGLIIRIRERRDRRVVRTRITGDGLRLVGSLDQKVALLHERQLGHLGGKKLGVLIDLLESAREGMGA
jgi:DNA-binding MarR family transcriptional regulator